MPVDRLAAYLKGKAIYSKATLWSLGLYPVHARTVSADGENGFIDYIFFGNYNWVQRGRKSHYGYIGIEVKFQSVLYKEHFYYPFNSGIDWNTQPNHLKYCDLTTLDQVFGPTKLWTSEILVRRKVNFSDVVCLHIPEGVLFTKQYPELSIDADDSVKEFLESWLSGNSLGHIEVKEKKLNPSQEKHAKSKGYKIVFDNTNSLGVELEDTQFSSEHFDIEDFDGKKLVFFFVPDSNAISGLIANDNNELFVRNTQTKVGKLESDPAS